MKKIIVREPRSAITEIKKGFLSSKMKELKKNKTNDSS